LSDGHKALTTAENLEVKRPQTAPKAVLVGVEGESGRCCKHMCTHQQHDRAPSASQLERKAARR